MFIHICYLNYMPCEWSLMPKNDISLKYAITNTCPPESKETVKLVEIKKKCISIRTVHSQHTLISHIILVYRGRSHEQNKL